MELSQVRLIHGDQGVMVGQPLVERGESHGGNRRPGPDSFDHVFKKQRRKNYRRTKGHRQGFTKLRITGIATA